MRISIVNGLAVLITASALGATVAYTASADRPAASSHTETVADLHSGPRGTPQNAPQGDSQTKSAAAEEPISKIADLSRIDGAATAKIWVVEISDMQCPFCKKWHSEVYPKLHAEFVKTGKIRFAYLNFPLSQHKHARPAAIAAMCGGVQGKFWPMHDAIFNTQDTWSAMENAAPHFESLAAKAGLNVTDWKACLTNPDIDELIEADRERAKGAGVQSTPSFMVAGRLVEGGVPFEEISKIINDAIAAQQQQR